MTEARKIGELPDGWRVYQVVAPLDEQIEAFHKLGIPAPYLVDVEKTAEIRASGISDDWTRTSIVPLALEGGRTILRRNSPYMNPVMAEFAVNAHRNGMHPSLSIDVYEIAKALAKSQEGMEPEDRTAIILSFEGDGALTPEMEETRFLLRRQVVPYFSKSVPSGRIPFFNLQGNSKKETTANYLWFDDPRSDSGLDCRGWSLYFAYKAFGVLRTGEASAQNSGYSLTEIGKANSAVIGEVLREEGESALIPIVARPLNRGLINRLRGSR